MSTYNPDYIDDREYQRILDIEQEVMREMKWRTEREVNDTRALCEQIRDLVNKLETIG